MKRHPRHSGFTLIELMFGAGSMAVIGLAIMMFMLASTTAWQTRDQHLEVAQITQQVSNKISAWVKAGERVVDVQTDSITGDTTIILWANDDYFQDEVNLGEIRMITWDVSASTVILHAADLTDAQLGSAASNPAITPTSVASTSFPAWFEAQTNVGEYVMAESVTKFIASPRTEDGDMNYTYLHLSMLIGDENGAVDQQFILTGAQVRVPDETVDFGTVAAVPVPE